MVVAAAASGFSCCSVLFLLLRSIPAAPSSIVFGCSALFLLHPLDVMKSRICSVRCMRLTQDSNIAFGVWGFWNSVNVDHQSPRPFPTAPP